MRLFAVIFLATSAIVAGSAFAQGTQDYTGPRPHYQSGPIPSNVARPVPNRQSNIFSPGVRPPRARPIYRRAGTRR